MFDFINRSLYFKNMRKKYFIFLIFLSGCMVGPDYKSPDVSMPENFIEADPSIETITSLKSWWETFQNKELNELIETGIANNYNLLIAVEKIEEARAFYRIKRADLFPEVDVTANALRQGISQNYAQTSFIPTTTFNTFQTGFDATWEIDIFGKLRGKNNLHCFNCKNIKKICEMFISA